MRLDNYFTIVFGERLNPQVRQQPLNCTPTELHTNGFPNCCQVRMAQHVGWRMVGDLRLPNARRVVSEAFRNLTLKTVVVKMPPDISTPKMQPMQSIKTQRVSRTLPARILHRSVVQRALSTRDFLTFFPTHLLVFFAVGTILC